MAKSIVLCAKSSSGKDTILNSVFEKGGCTKVVSHTTRPRRENEVHGRDYYFVSDDEFDIMLSDDEFIETRIYETEYGTWKYGVSKTAIDMDSNNIYIKILDIGGLKEIVKYMSKDNVYSIYIEANPSTRLIRSVNRQHKQIDEELKSHSELTIDEILRRIKADEIDFKDAKETCTETLYNETKDDLENIISYISNDVINKLNNKGDK